MFRIPREGLKDIGASIVYICSPEDLPAYHLQQSLISALRNVLLNREYIVELFGSCYVEGVNLKRSRTCCSQTHRSGNLRKLGYCNGENE